MEVTALSLILRKSAVITGYGWSKQCHCTDGSTAVSLLLMEVHSITEAILGLVFGKTQCWNFSAASFRKTNITRELEWSRIFLHVKNMGI